MVVKKIVLCGIIILAFAGCQGNKMDSPLNSKSTENQASQEESLKENTIIKVNDITDKRTLLTKDKYPSQFPNPEACEKASNFNDESPTTTIFYSNPKIGIAFDLPYNPNWGNQEFKINSYDSEENEISFGPIQDLGACNWLRPYYLKILPKRTAEEGVQSIKNDYRLSKLEIPPSIIKMNNFNVVQYVSAGVCYTPTLEIIGEKYNYQFYALSCSLDQKKAQEDLKLLENIIKTAHLN